MWKVCSNEQEAKKWVESYPHKHGDIVEAYYKEFELDKDYDFPVEWG
jgi:hypothetical protein